MPTSQPVSPLPWADPDVEQPDLVDDEDQELLWSIWDRLTIPTDQVIVKNETTPR